MLSINNKSGAVEISCITEYANADVSTKDFVLHGEEPFFMENTTTNPIIVSVKLYYSNSIADVTLKYGRNPFLVTKILANPSVSAGNIKYFR